MAKNKKPYTKKDFQNIPPTFSQPVPKNSKTSFLNQFSIQAFFLTVVCFVFYSNTFHNGYAVDDFLVIENNQAISRGVEGIPKILTSDVFDSYYKRYNANNQLSGGRYRPLALVSYAIEQQLFGQPIDATDKNAAKENIEDTSLIHIQHVDNVLLYILSVIVLLYFLRKVVFPSQPLIAFLSVLIFAIHPIHTEVVANIKSRDEILSLLFITLTLITAYNYKEKNKLPSLLLALVFFFLALLSKEYAVTLIVLIPLMFYLFKNHSVGKSIQAMLPFLGVLVLYLIMRYSFVPFKGGKEDDDILNNPYLLATGAEKIATEIATLLNYIKLLLFPHPLSVDYSYNEIPYKNFGDVLFWLSLVFHVCLVAIMIYFIRKRNVLAFAIAIYLVNLFLVSNLAFSIGASMGERLIYHSSLGFSIGIAYLFYIGYKKIKQLNVANMSLTVCVLLIVLLCGIKTIDRNKDWESNSTLYRKDVLAASNSAATNGNAGNAYLQLAPQQDNEFAKKEMLDKAMSYLNKAISINPGYTLAYINRGSVFFEQGDMEHAKQDWDSAKAQYPTYPDLPGLYASYYINTSISKYGSKGMYNEAITEIQKGLSFEPQNLILLFNLGYYYNSVGKKDSAINTFQKIIDIKPQDTLAAKCASFIEILKKAP